MPPETGIFVQVLLAFFSISVVIVGWNVIYKNARRIATRNESFTLIKEVIDRVELVREKAVDLQTENDKKKKLCKEASIAPEIKFIRSRLKQLKESRKIEIDDNGLITSLRRASTMYAKPDESDQSFQKRLNNIHSTCFELRQTMYDAFEKRYKPTH